MSRIDLSTWGRHVVGGALVASLAAATLGAAPASARPSDGAEDTSSSTSRAPSAQQRLASSSADEPRYGTAPNGVPYLQFNGDPLLPTGPAVYTSDNLEHVANTPIPSALSSNINSNIAFNGDYAYQGNYNGMAIYDISTPEQPTLVSTLLCPGGQGDISLAGDLAFFSVDSPRNGSACGAPAVAASNAAAWEGIRIFDVSDPANPAYVGAVQTRCGSHTNTLVPKPGDDGSVYVFNSAYDVSATAAYCRTPHQQVEVIEVDLDNPGAASVVKELKFWDENNPAFTAADRKDGGASTSVTNGCHDLTSFPEKNLLAAACMGDGVMLDITDPLNPTVIDRVRDENFAFWHTAQFSNDASTVIFQDELGGGVGATCVPGTLQYRGANGIYSFADGELELKSYYKIPRRQSTTEACVVHEGNVIPHPTRDILVQAFYEGGVSVIDFTDPTRPHEIEYFDYSPSNPRIPGGGGTWAAYLHNGYIYSSEITLGLDVMKLTGDDYVDARRYRRGYNSPAMQETFSLPWLTAPSYESLEGLAALTATPASVAAGVETEVTVTAPAGTYDGGEYVEAWSTGTDAASLGTTQAAADGSLSLTVTVSGDQPVGTLSMVLRGDSELDGDLRVASVEVGATSTSTSLSASSSTQVYGGSRARLTAVVDAGDASATGSVVFVRGETRLARVPLVEGRAVYSPSALHGVGDFEFSAVYEPADERFTASSSESVALRVVPGASSTRIGIGAGRVSTNANATVKVRVAGPVAQTGRVTVVYGNRSLRATVRNGAVDVRLPKLTAGSYRVFVTYDGNRNVNGSRSAAATLTVVQR